MQLQSGYMKVTGGYGLLTHGDMKIVSKKHPVLCMEKRNASFRFDYGTGRTAIVQSSPIPFCCG